nr:unnamed protein product [Digitaria exilis]
MLAVAAEFNAPVTAFLAAAADTDTAASAPRFHIRWFTTVTEVELCGHSTLAAAYFLLTGGVVGSGTDAIEFVTLSGMVLTARLLVKEAGNGKRACNDFSVHRVDRGGFCIELDFPVATVEECVPGEVMPTMPDTLNGASVVNVCKTSTIGDLMASSRGGTLRLELDEHAQRVRIRGEAVTVMVGTLLA